MISILVAAKAMMTMNLYKTPLEAALAFMQTSARKLKASLSDPIPPRPKSSAGGKLRVPLDMWVLSVELFADHFKDLLKEKIIVKNDGGFYHLEFDFFKMHHQDFTFNKYAWKVELKTVYEQYLPVDLPTPVWQLYIPVTSDIVQKCKDNSMAWLDASNHIDVWDMLKRRLDSFAGYYYIFIIKNI